MEREFIKFLLALIVIVVFVIILIVTPVVYYNTMGKINEFNATKQTIECARVNGEKLENAAIAHKIIECNQWLKSSQYFNSTIWGIFIPNDVNELSPIK